jgi:hypothetical protein
VTELKKAVADLTPWKTKAETLQKLFTSDYKTARERFVSTFGSETGLSVFPDFDAHWQELQQETQDDGNAAIARKRAFDDVLTYTTYLKGDSGASARDSAQRIARSDDDYKKVLDSIDTLLASGAEEPAVNTDTTQLYGTVINVFGTKVVLEPLTKVQPHEGQQVELRRVQGKKETVLGRGTVVTASNLKVELDWKGNSSVPFSGDPAYLVLP